MGPKPPPKDSVCSVSFFTDTIGSRDLPRWRARLNIEGPLQGPKSDLDPKENPIGIWGLLDAGECFIGQGRSLPPIWGKGFHYGRRPNSGRRRRSRRRHEL